MDKNEAKVVIGIMTSADGGCPYCVQALIKDFLKKFPEFENLALEIYPDLFERL